VLGLLKSRLDEAASDGTHEVCPNSPFGMEHHGLEQFTRGTQRLQTFLSLTDQDG